jgi:hypothetical protein
MKLDRAILAGLSDSVPGNSCAHPVHETSVNKNPMLTLIAIVLYFRTAICITVKRLRDIDAPGSLSIPVALIPIAVMLVGSFPGTIGPNRFGPRSTGRVMRHLRRPQSRIATDHWDGDVVSAWSTVDCRRAADIRMPLRTR